jgi:sec-independent protein translocase protein TatB
MCGVSGIELLVIVAIAVIVVGPERLPDLMRAAGKLMRQVRAMTGDLGQVTREIQSTVNVDEIRKQLREEMQIERARFRQLAQETEIDAIRARKPKAAPTTEAAATKSDAPSASDDAESMPQGLMTPLPAPAPPKAEAAAAAVRPSPGVDTGDDGDGDAEPAPALPTIRPASNTFTRTGRSRADHRREAANSTAESDAAPTVDAAEDAK